MSERTQPIYGGAGPEPQFVTDPTGSPHGDTGRRLVVVGGAAPERMYLLTSAECLIGRDPDADVALPDDPTVSRTHASIRFEGGAHVLHDAGSSNGTFVNGVALTSCALSPGDVIQCGSVRLRYE